MAEHPYRVAIVRVEGSRTRLAESERPPHGVSVQAWSDGTTQLSLRVPSRYLGRTIYALLTFGVIAGLTSTVPCEAGGAIVLGSLFALLTLRTFRGERISISPASVSRRCRFGAGQARPLTEVSTIVVSGRGKQTRLDLQCGRERVPSADGLGYDEETLRWIAKRLRSALEAAR